GDQSGCFVSTTCPLRPCCFGESCVLEFPADCIAKGGEFINLAADCDSVFCDDLLPCCLGQGVCVEVTSLECFEFGGIQTFSFLQCVDNPCPDEGACCLPNGCTEAYNEADCMRNGGTFLGIDALCADSEFDRDGDGIPDVCDACPDDPLKAYPGRCGCGVLEDMETLDVVALITEAGDPPSPLGGPNGVVVTEEGRLLITDDINDAFEEYSTDGTYVDSINMPFVLLLSEPTDVSYRDSEARLTHAASGDIQVIRRNGGAFVFVGFSNPTALLDQPMGTDVDRIGRTYVAEFGAQQIAVFSESNQPGGTFDLAGSILDGTPFGPQAVHVTSDDRLLVADRLSHRIVVFDLDGTVLNDFGAQGSGDGQFDVPLDVTTDPAGRVYVTDSGNERIVVFDSGGAFLFTIGGPGNGPMQFDGIRQVDIDLDYAMYVTEAGNARVQILAPAIELACPTDCVPDNGDGTTGNGTTNVDDLLAVINAFGSVGGACDVAPVQPDCSVGNDVINIDDLLAVINAFGPCPDEAEALRGQ
ncbi:MAG: NHL repeat-containing protein, partial [Planctomycetota bacterium]